MDACLTIHADQETRIERVISRDGAKRVDVMARMHNQLSDEFRLSMSDYVIDNNGDQLLLPQVLKKHKLFLALARKK